MGTGSISITIRKYVAPIAFFFFLYLIIESNACANDVITVTARKFSESKNAAPLTIDVLHESNTRDHQLNSLKDLQNLLPNFFMGQGSSITRRVIIRGVGTFSRNIGFDTRVGVYVDGVYVGQSIAADMNLADIERVEVVRGPVGAYSGKNAVSGAINIVTKKPMGKRSGRLNIERGKYDLLSETLSYTEPINETNSVSLVLHRVNRAGNYRNINDGTDLNTLNRRNGRIKWRSFMGDALELNFSADGYLDKRNFTIGDPISNTFGAAAESTAPNDYEVNYNINPHETKKGFGVSLQADLSLDHDATLTSITGLRRSAVSYLNDTDYSTLDVLSVQYDDEYRQVSQEFRYQCSLNDKFDLSSGIYFSNQIANSHRVADFGTQVGLMPFGVTPADEVPVFGTVRTTNFSIFSHFNVQLADDWVLGLGLRETYETKKADFEFDGSNSGAFNIAVGNVSDSVSNYSFDPSLSLTHTINESHSIYGAINLGSKSGGFNLDFVTPNAFSTGLAFKDEHAVNYEVGSRNQLFNKKLSLDVSAFIMKFRDYQVNQFMDLGAGATAITIKNAGRVTSHGAEISSIYKPHKKIELGTNIGLLYATFDDFAGGGLNGADASGNELPFAPHASGNITGKYTETINNHPVILSLTYFRTQGQYTNASNLKERTLTGGGTAPFGYIRAYGLLSAKLSILDDKDHWEAYIYGKNLNNQHYLTDSIRDFLGTLISQRGEPRTVGLGASLKF